MSNDAYPLAVSTEEGASHWRYWGTERIAIAEYANEAITGVVTCVDGQVGNWMVRAGSTRFAEGITRGSNAFAEAIAEVEAAARRHGALGEADREWHPLLFRAIEQTASEAPPSD